jgi:DNA-binding SARP family transcriptional activator
MQPVWTIELFGGVRAIRSGTVVDRFRVQKAGALLGYLAYYRRPHARDLLIQQFWPDDDLATGRHKLSVALSFLRQALEPPEIGDGAVIEADRASVGLAAGAAVIDAAEFDAALRRAATTPDSVERIRHLSQAVALYGGELLSGYYDNWIFSEQQRQALRFLEAVRQLIALQIEAGEPTRALEAALQAVAADPLSEELHLEVMRLQLSLGRPAATLRQYRELERILREELDAAPSADSDAVVRSARDALVAGGERPGEDDASLVAAASISAAPTSAAVDPPVASPESRIPGASAPVPLMGAVPIGSPFYVTRAADREVSDAIAARSSIVLLQGARQVGKTSLLGRALAEARESGARIVSTDFQGFSAVDLRSPGSLLLALANEIADQLDLDADPAESLGPDRSPAVGFRRFLRREVLDAGPPLVWGMDEVDRLFNCDFHSEIFGLFRFWHNQRVLDPSGPSGRLTQVIAYATEAHLFITDIHQSPFNVGTRIELADFSLEQTADLNRRYGSPVLEPDELERLQDLLGGHPYLTQRGLSYAAGAGGWTALEAAATREDGPFADHLRRLLLLLGRAPELCEAVREVLRGRPCPSLESFYRLRSSGILSGPSSQEARPRCRLYAESLSRHLL